MGRRTTIALAIALLLAALPTPAGADPGHAFGSPHLNQRQQANQGSGGDSSTLLVIATLATLVVFAGCAVVLKQAQQNRD
jgi:hypothetical protein